MFAKFLSSRSAGSGVNLHAGGSLIQVRNLASAFVDLRHVPLRVVLSRSKGIPASPRTTNRPPHCRGVLAGVQRRHSHRVSAASRPSDCRVSPTRSRLARPPQWYHRSSGGCGISMVLRSQSTSELPRNTTLRRTGRKRGFVQQEVVLMFHPFCWRRPACPLSVMPHPSDPSSPCRTAPLFVRRDRAGSNRRLRRRRCLLHRQIDALQQCGGQQIAANITSCAAPIISWSRAAVQPARDFAAFSSRNRALVRLVGVGASVITDAKRLVNRGHRPHRLFKHVL